MKQASADALLDQARDRLRRAYPDALALYVFGSTAADGRHPDSDLDLAILAAGPLDRAELYENARAFEVDLGVDVDLIDLRSAPTVLKKEIISMGRQLYCADRDATLDFEARVLSEYGRYREGLGPLIDAVRDSGQAYRR